MARKSELIVISLGAGVQSSVMTLMAARGLIRPMPDVAIFADTGWEPAQVYEHLDWLEDQLPFPVLRVSAGNIREAVVGGFSHKNKKKDRQFTVLPAFSSSGSISVRQCTGDYKIKPIVQSVRELLGYRPGERVSRGTRVQQWLGISADEWARSKDNPRFYIENRYPLLELEMARADCLLWFARHYPDRKLAKSACIGCPFHNDAEWWDMKRNRSDEFEDACEIDELLRAGAPRMQPRAGEKDDGHQYLHHSGRPLREAVSRATYKESGTLGLFASRDNWINECEGMCGV